MQNSVAAIATCLAPIYMSLFLQDVLGMDSMQAGVSMFLPSILMAVMAPVAAKGAEKFSSRFVIFCGMILLLYATWEISHFALSTTILMFTVWLSLRYIGLGMITPMVNNSSICNLSFQRNIITKKIQLVHTEQLYFSSQKSAYSPVIMGTQPYKNAHFMNAPHSQQSFSVSVPANYPS